MQARGLPVSPFLLICFPISSASGFWPFGEDPAAGRAGQSGRLFQGNGIMRAGGKGSRTLVKISKIINRHKLLNKERSYTNESTNSPLGKKVFPVLLSLALVGFLGSAQEASAQGKLKVGILHIGSIADAGYNQAHAEGFR